MIIAGGKNESTYSSAYILNITFELNGDVSKVSYTVLDDIPNCSWMSFYQRCQDKIIIGGGRGTNPWDNLNQVVEFSENKWKSVPSLNVIRDKCPASCFVNNTLIVAGGYEPNYGRLDSIEYIEITNDKDSSNEWNLCRRGLPIKVLAHTISELNGKVYLIGGNVIRGTKSNKIWEGTIHPGMEFTFKEIDSMREERIGHFSIVVKNQIHVFGGEKDRSNSLVEVFDGKEWSVGTHFPFYLDSSNGNAVLNRWGLIVITTNEHGIVIYNPVKRTIKCYPDFKLKESREYYAAVLLH